MIQQASARTLECREDTLNTQNRSKHLKQQTDQTNTVSCQWCRQSHISRADGCTFMLGCLDKQDKTSIVGHHVFLKSRLILCILFTVGKVNAAVNQIQ